MGLDSPYFIVFEAVLVGQCLLVITQLLLHGRDRPWSRLLIGFFLGLLLGQTGSLLVTLKEPTAFALLGLSGEYLAIATLWLYVCTITAPTRKLQRWDWILHGLPVALCAATAFPFALAPEQVQVELMQTGDLDTLEKRHIVLAWVLADIVWSCLAPIYLVCAYRRVQRYRVRLRDEFSSLESRELNWVSLLIFVFMAYWLIDLGDTLDYLGADVSFSLPLAMLVNVLVIGIPSLWGLQQKPTFLPEPEPDPSNAKTTTSTLEPVEDLHPKHRYANSALTTEHQVKLKIKLEALMADQKIYQDPNLSLSALAKELNTNPHYLSQTLNGLLNESFFEFVNRLRAEEAALLLTSTELTVGDIAMQSGFNTRSSFYTAFKKRYQCTPSAYKKQVAS